MTDAPRKKIFFERIRIGCLLSLLLFCCPSPTKADQFPDKILLRPDFNLSRSIELREKLRQITGWEDLGFDENGALIPGGEKTVGGSPTARKLLTEAARGENVIVLEDASNRQDIAFCSVVEGRWKTDVANKPPVFIILIDFADFAHVTGDKAALAAFNEGWGVLHEIEHVIHDAADTSRLGELGDCEGLINLMRRECGLAERADYFFTLFPGSSDSGFMTKVVRLAFDITRPGTNKKKRFWLVWDARLVGGVDQQKSVVARL